MSRLHLLPVSSRALATSAPYRAPLSSLARPVAEKISAGWKGTSMTGGTTKNFIGGQFVESRADTWLEVLDPVCSVQRLRNQYSSEHVTQSTQTLLSRVPQTTAGEFEQAVDAAAHAFNSWSKTSVLTRQRFVLEWARSLSCLQTKLI